MFISYSFYSNYSYNGPKPCVNIFLKFTVTCFRFNIFGRVFHICVPKVANLFVPYLVVLCLFTIRLFSQTLGLTLKVKISFISEGFNSLIVLNISVVKILIRFTFTVDSFSFSKSVL